MTAGFDKKLCVKLFHCGNINPVNKHDREQKNIFFMPMGLFPLGRILKDNGFEVEIIHSDLLDDIEAHLIADWSTVDAVGFDCHWVNQSLAILETAKMLKKINPGIFIFLGGYTASFFCEEIIEDYTQIDAVIRGDGERPIVELCKCLKNKLLPGGKRCRIDKVPNLVWRSEENKTVFNDFSYVATAGDMEKLDFAAVDLLRNWEYYRLASKFWSRFKIINTSSLFFLEVGRGCRFACLFCGGNCEAQKRMSNRSRFVIRSTDSVLDTVKKAFFSGFGTFYTSFEFPGSDSWYIDLLMKLGESDLKINYVYGSWKLPSRELIDALSKNCRHVIFEISPETADESLRRRNKDPRIYYSNEELEACLDYIVTKRNIKVQLYFGYFLSSDTAATIYSTFDYIIQLALKYREIAELEYFNFSTDPASLLYLYPEKYGVQMYVRSFRDYIRYIKENYVIKNKQSADLRVFKPVGLSDMEVSAVERKVKLFNLLFNTFRKTISYGLLNTGESGLVHEVLAEFKSVENLETSFCPDTLRYSILKVFRTYNIAESDVLNILNDDLQNHKMKKNNNKATPQIWITDTVLKKPGSENESLTYKHQGIDFKNNRLNIEFDF